MPEKQAHSSFKHVRGEEEKKGRKRGGKHGQFLDNATHSNFTQCERNGCQAFDLEQIEQSITCCHAHTQLDDKLQRWQKAKVKWSMRSRSITRIRAVVQVVVSIVAVA